MSATVIDQLITKFGLDEKDYEKGKEALLHATHQITHEIDEAVAKAKERFKEIFKPVINPFTELVTGAGLFELGKEALGVATEFDKLERKIAGVTGSYKRAKEIMELSEHQAAATGLFDVKSLDEAALKLEVFGLKAETFLPVVEKLGAVFGDGSEGLDTFAEALGRIQEGNAGRAMSILARSGIGQKDLQQHGVAFNGKELASPASKVIQAIEEVVDIKFGPVLKEMLDSPEARTAKLSVAWESAMRRSGQAIQQFLLPGVEGVAAALEHIVSGGQLDKINTGFSSLFHLDTASVQTAVQTIANTLEKLPGQIEGPLNTVKGVLGWVIEHAVTLGKVWAAIWVTQKVAAGLSLIQTITTGIGQAIWAMTGAQVAFDIATGVGVVLVVGMAATAVAAYIGIRNAIDSAADSTHTLTGEAQGYAGALDTAAGSAEKLAAAAKRVADNARLGNLLSEHEKMVKHAQELEKSIAETEAKAENVRQGNPNKTTYADELDRDAASMRKALASVMKQIGQNKADYKAALAERDKAPATAEDAKKAQEVAKSNDYLAQIAGNTQKMAVNFSRFAFGGGELGAIGASPADLVGFRPRKGSAQDLAGQQRKVQGAVMTFGGGLVSALLQQNVIEAIDKYVEASVAHNLAVMVH